MVVAVVGKAGGGAQSVRQHREVVNGNGCVGIGQPRWCGAVVRAAD